MHTVFKKTLVIASLLLVARSAAAVDEFSGPTPQALDDTYLTALAAAAVTANQAPPDPQAVSAIPEPPVYIMLLVGVGLLGLVARRQTIPPIFKNEQD